ncbi:MAG: transposase [Rickettsia endosymbiont of Labidopullus appendiculatus]|nr:transposase [Rickettsia endosymbiont of Labidopullus appendiculatus]
MPSERAYSLVMVERSGNVKAQGIEKVKIKTIEKTTMNNITIGSTILSRVLQNFYNVLFKHGVFGVYHSISEKHTERYLVNSYEN